MMPHLFNYLHIIIYISYIIYLRGGANAQVDLFSIKINRWALCIVRISKNIWMKVGVTQNLLISLNYGILSLTLVPGWSPTS